MRPILSILLLLVAYRLAAQQNLIQNGGFEQHAGQSCLICNTLYGQYAGLVPHWDNGGHGCILCDKDYKQLSDEKEWSYCPMDRISPHSGKAMVAIAYWPNKLVRNEYGHTDHLTARSTQTLQVGHLYEVSCWLYIDSLSRADPDWAKHIGIALLPQKVQVISVTGAGTIPNMPIDTVMYNKWYQVKWRIRPLCTSDYLMIGLFGNERWPKSESYRQSRYYLDDISMIEIPSTSAVRDSSIFYCSRYDPKTNPGLKPRMDNMSLRFQTASFELTTQHKASLDSIASFAKKYAGTTFEISGHTDSIGSENLELSQQRMQAVLHYLRDTHQLADVRFVTLSLGSKRPVSGNNTEAGRALNRRVDVRQSEHDLSVLLYRRAVEAAKEKNYKQAYTYLDRWLLNPGGIIMLFDPRFDPMKKDKRWAKLEQKVRDSYRDVKYARYAFFIDSLRMDDRRAIGELSVLLNDCTGIVPEVDTVPFYLPRLPQEEVDQKLKEHFAGLKPILDKVGFPKKSEFGGSAGTAFILLQHSLDSATYIKWLPALKKNCEEGEASWMWYAMVYDRCQLIANKPQRYATHVEHLPDGSMRVSPCEGDEDTINEHRALIGLPLLMDSVAEALKRVERP